MNKKRYITILLWSLSLFTFAQTSNLSFINFNDKDGLTEKYIYAVAQDTRRLIWIGTGSGLYRFDGRRFTKFNSPIDRPGRQISNVLQNVYCDRSGKLWLSSINAMQVFDPVQNTFSAANYRDKKINRMIQSFIMGFYEDSQNTMWIATQSNFWYRYDKKTKEVQHFVPKANGVTVESKNVVKILETPNGRLWAITTNGLFEFFRDGSIQPHWNIKNEKPLANHFYDGYYDVNRNCIWLAAGYNGIACYNLSTATFVNQPLIVPNSKNSNPAHFVSLITPKDSNSIWFAAGYLGQYNIQSKQFINYEPLYKDEFSFKTTPISRFLYDREHNLWIASYAGLSMLSWQNNQIKSYPLLNSFAEYTVEPYGALPYKNGYLIANNTSNGLLWLKPDEAKIDLIENPYYKGQFRTMKGIESMVKTADNQIYCASAQQLFFLNQANNTLLPLNVKDQNGKPLVNIVRMISDSSGILYLSSSNNGFYRFNPNEKKVFHIQLSDITSNHNTDTGANLSPRIQDRDGNIWFTKTQGVYCWQKKSRKYIHLATGKAANNGASISQSVDITQDQNGHYWITTIDNGLFELIFQNGKQKLLNYTKENSGLPSDYCGNVFTEKKGFVWVGTSNGLLKFDPVKKEVVTLLGQQQGFKDNFIAVATNFHDNTILVNHYGQLSILDLNTYKFNVLQPKVFFTDIRVLDRFLTSKDLQKGAIMLKHTENFISIDWCSGIYNNGNQNRFAYKLSKLNKDWVFTDKNSVTFSNLEHGDYIFEVKSANNDGVWGEVTSFKIEIATPFWKAWWFYGLIVISIGGVLYAFYQYKLKQVKKEESLNSKYMQQIAEIEMKALRAQMNPHFIFNSLNSIQRYILKNDSFAASQYLTKFSKLIRLILDHSNQNYIVLSSEVELLTLYIEIEALRFDNQFEYEIIVDHSLYVETVQIPSMIIQPYIENAIWHGLLHKETKGKLRLTIARFDENNIKIKVEDDGIGREKAQELKSKQILKKKSYGLQITKDRISILNKTQSSKTTLKIYDLKDENGNATGTLVELIIPIQNIK
jgi:ligand-binding sensor domain-containing protein